MSYKDLKKQLKLIYPKQGEIEIEIERPNKQPRLSLGDQIVGRDGVKGSAGECSVSVGGEEVMVTKEVTDFVRLLEDEIEKFNAFFVDNEEEYIIKLKVI